MVADEGEGEEHVEDAEDVADDGAAGPLLLGEQILEEGRGGEDGRGGEGFGEI